MIARESRQPTSQGAVSGHAVSAAKVRKRLPGGVCENAPKDIPFPPFVIGRAVF